MVIKSSTEKAFYPETALTTSSNFYFEVIHGRSVMLSPDFTAFIKNEFKTLCTFHPRIMLDDGRFFRLMAPEALDPVNKTRNRYPDVLPYPENRFRFRDPLLYSNSSIVLGGTAITCQGPQENEFKRFWRMVWEFNATAVVMATDFIENSKRKCHRYFPSKNGEGLPPANLEELPKEQDLEVVKIDGPELPAEGAPTQPAVTIRTILLQHGQEKKEVAHVKIERWLDNEAMDEFTLAEAVRFVAHHLEKTKGRLVSHCSAGIGRSGVFLAILEALLQLKKGKPVTSDFIYEIVKSLRSKEHGRNGMVQALPQYELIFKTLILLDGNFGKQLCALLKKPSGLS
jgi:receptor-type tyrosine-protein phosphatase V